MRRVLVANRGEIAVRVIRGCRDEGLEVVAIHSDPDATALHVRLADAAVRVGEAPSSQSYLLASRIIDAARTTGADAIHPGYGFLSENAGFAREVVASGLTWIGPPPAAIEAMGDKARARATVIAAGVPVVPGTEPLGDEEAVEAARRVGFPLLIKAVAGGGGKGMRRVDSEGDVRSAIAAARSEARSSFGDDQIYFEKFLARPHHVEIQVFGGPDGKSIHLGERDCSVQRRHQKIIEESPSPIMTPELRARMGAVAVAAADAVGYVGAGTVEFLVDPDDVGPDGLLRFHFLEMNTRLQVEHPVTELVTGLDLVRWQLGVARGEPLPLRQEQVELRGHALEARIYAEDASRDFSPSPGRLLAFRPPQGPGVRCDSGVEAGDDVSIYYDPMIAKLLTWGSTRDEAMARMKRALTEFDIAGVATNIPFHLHVLDLPEFRRGRCDVNFVDREMKATLPTLGRIDSRDARIEVAAVLFALEEESTRTVSSSNAAGESRSPAWRIAGRTALQDRR